MAPDRMVLALDHDRWAAFFREEEGRVAEALSFLSPRIEHVGSTAVPGLLSKPVVDVGVVADLDAFSACLGPLEALGYRHRGQHGDDPLRRYFVLEADGRRVVQLHLWAETGVAWREAVAFRDLLRDREDLRAAYAAEKRRVAREVEWDKRAYSLAKGTFVDEVLQRWVRSRS